MKQALLWALLLGALFWGPWLQLFATTEIVDVDHAVPAQAALIFGARVREGVISPLHEERLLSAKALLDKGKAERLVVSNSTRAANFMKSFLLETGVDEAVIEVDGDAVKTSDTCVAEAARDELRRVILVSQSFHLPRIAMQCREVGITGQYLAAESIRGGASDASFWTKLRVRTKRYAREAALVWAVYLGVYEQV